MRSQCYLICFLTVLLTTTCKTRTSTTFSPVEPAIQGIVNNPTHFLTKNALGLDFEEVSFRWSLPTDLDKQGAFQILVASDLRKLNADVGDLWDSGIRYSDSLSAKYAGKQIPLKGAWWKMRIWDENLTPQPFTRDSLRIENLSNDDKFRIVFLGGTTIAEMEKFGWMEAAMTARWPYQNITFRNIGWPGDDVMATARSEFGSALNTESWKPPDREDIYGLEVLKAHLDLVNADVVMLGYGSEAAFAESDEKFDRFTSGYRRLLDQFDTTETKLILLSPHRHWKVSDTQLGVDLQNERLKKASDQIREEALNRQHQFVNLYESLIPEDDEVLTTNGIHLNNLGYQKMASVIMNALAADSEYLLNVDPKGNVLFSENCQVSEITPTPSGFRFTLQADMLNTRGIVKLNQAHILKIDGEVNRENSGTDEVQNPDWYQYEKLRKLIIEKNRLHRFRINPLNKVYTHLFRQHEMGHLAYETDDYARLTQEKDELIARTRVPQSHRYEIELLDSWKSPRNYRDHEVPSFIPEPDIKSELDAFTIDDDFEINLFAADPQIANPISITWDNQGRAWVSTSTTYPQLKPGREPVDRIIILEDTDQDGKADKHIVFAENLLIPHAVMPVEGGAYVSTTSELLFLADTDGDDKADERKVVFSGFGHSDVHHTLHGMRWTPWGDLHLIQSIYINTFLETAYGPRRLNGTGIWQFRPESEKLEIFSTGLVNPWGEAFDDWGQAFATDGAGSQQPNYIFPGSAHMTAVGADRILDGLMYGKPKNTSAEFITGSHIRPDWRGDLLANDYRANRTVRYKISESGSGFTAKEEETFIHSSHRSYRPVDIKQGPDGAIYIVDWYSPIIDHGEVDFYHPSRDKTHGRIWRVTSKNRPLNRVSNLQQATTTKLLDMLKSTTQFTRLQANRELVRRNCPSTEIENWVNQLSSKDRRYEHHKLEALWLSVALDSTNPKLLSELLKSRDHRIRAAAIRMLPRILSDDEGERMLNEFVNDPHPRVRLETVNSLRRMATPNAAQIALRALEFSIDNNLDYMLWLTARELSAQWLPALDGGGEVFDNSFERTAFALKSMNNSTAAGLLANYVREGKFEGTSKKEALTMIANFGDSVDLDLVLEEISQTKDTLLLETLVNAPKENKSVATKNEMLQDLHVDSIPKIRELTAMLYGRWKIQDALESLMMQTTDTSLIDTERIAAGDAILSLGDTTSLIELATKSPIQAIRSTSLVTWIKAAPDSAAVSAADFIVKSDSLKEAMLVFSTLNSQKGGTKILEAQFGDRKLARNKAVEGLRIVQSSGRDLQSLADILKKAGGLKPVGLLDSAQRNKLIADVELSGNARRGSSVYWKPSLLCSSCHRINGEGGLIGPDLSYVGAFMTPESILEAMENPSTAIKQGYETVIITKTDGSVISGTLERRTDEGARIRNVSGQVQLIRSNEIENFEVTPISLMPPGLTSTLSPDELTDLMAFLTQLGKEE